MSDGPTGAPSPMGDPALVGMEAFGTRISVAVPVDELVPQVVEQFPLYAKRCPPGSEDPTFVLEEAEEGGFVLFEQGKAVARPPEASGALALLRRRLFRHAIEHARTRLAVHAGVVGHRGWAIVLPAPAMAGKTTLVVALVRAGAHYLTDDFALIDGQGLVHPYPSRLFIKNQEKASVESIGGVRGDRALPVGLIARVTFREEAAWAPQPRTEAEGMLMLIRGAYGMDVPAFAMQAARNAAADAAVIESERGEADQAAAALLETLSKREAPAPEPPPA